jgi:hypothetical protein
MFKTLTARAIIPVAVAVTGFVVVCCILLYSVMKTDMISDTTMHETNLANTIIKSTRYAMLKSDRDMLKNIIENIGDQKGVEHVRIFNKKGLIMFTEDAREINRFVDKKTSGCTSCHDRPVPAATIGSMKMARRFVNERGVEVLAITAPVYNEPACFNASCHVHSPAQKILGTLDIGLSADPLLKTLAVMRGRMIIFSIMVLILTIGGVAALLQRQVFIPLKEIKEFTANINRGNLTDELSDISGELTDLAENVRAVALRHKNAVREVEELKRNSENASELDSMTAPTKPTT